jgi:Tfp pilus assembly protein PilN
MINIGAADISLNAVEAQSYRDRLIEEIRRSIAIYLKERGQDASLVSQFIVTGSVNIIEDFKNTIAAQTGIVAEAIPVLSTLSLADGAMSEKGIAADSSVSVICGSLFMTEGINLVADELKKRQQQKAKLTKAIGLSIASALIILLTVSAVVARIYQKQKLIKQLQSMLDEINVTAGETEEKLKKIKILKQQSSEGASSLDAIYNLYKLIPSNISLVDFDYDDTQKAVRFRGRATNMSDVFKLATLLEGSDRFSNVQTRSVAKRTTQRGEVVDFQIWCNFSASAGEK